MVCSEFRSRSIRPRWCGRRLSKPVRKSSSRMQRACKYARLRRRLPTFVTTKKMRKNFASCTRNMEARRENAVHRGTAGCGGRGSVSNRFDDHGLRSLLGNATEQPATCASASPAANSQPLTLSGAQRLDRQCAATAAVVVIGCPIACKVRWNHAAEVSNGFPPLIRLNSIARSASPRSSSCPTTPLSRRKEQSTE